MRDVSTWEYIPVPFGATLKVGETGVVETPNEALKFELPEKWALDRAFVVAVVIFLIDL